MFPFNIITNFVRDPKFYESHLNGEIFTSRARVCVNTSIESGFSDREFTTVRERRRETRQRARANILAKFP